MLAFVAGSTFSGRKMPRQRRLRQNPHPALKPGQLSNRTAAAVARLTPTRNSCGSLSPCFWASRQWGHRRASSGMMASQFLHCFTMLLPAERLTRARIHHWILRRHPLRSIGRAERRQP